ncbi:histidine kinase [Parafrankia sp. FMc6]|uniref:sensor histidine kinase n=1 Tax=Parafrankia soli TaxID=2599596 RepID=UPI0034D79B0E
MIVAWWRDVPDRPCFAQVAVASLLLAAAVPGSRLQGSPLLDRPLWPALLSTGLACAALLLCRRHPLVTATLAASGAVALAALGYLLSPLLLGPLIVAVYWLALGMAWVVAGAFAAVTAAVLVGAALTAGPPSRPLVLETIGPVMWVLAPVVVGSWARLWRTCVRLLAERAANAERTRELEAANRAAEERLRIARDLHDVVAHHLALANAQASVAEHLLRTHPELAQRSLASLADTTMSALRDLKATVRVLRQPDEPVERNEPVGLDEPDGRNERDAPVPDMPEASDASHEAAAAAADGDGTGAAPGSRPGLARLPALIGAVRSAGLTVTVSTRGQPRQPVPAVDLAAFRIVQEALTNVTKHCPAASARVLLGYSGDRLTIAVTDGGGASSAGAAGTGFGLIGLRERAHAVGGRLLAGHRPEGGFEVRAELPLRAVPSAADPYSPPKGIRGT